MSKSWRIAGINFDHMHMGDLLRQVYEHPDAEIAGICDEDPARMQEAVANFNIPDERVFTEVGACMEQTHPDLVILCPATAGHAKYVEAVAPYGSHVLVEKPFAASLGEADRMIAAVQPGKQIFINWPLRWYPSHMTAQNLIAEGRIGDVIEIHYYDGNRGPLYHGADKIEQEPTSDRKAASWFYNRGKGGGSLLDYLGYGVTLGAWFDGGRIPEEITAVTGGEPSLEVDEHSITLCRYGDGRLSKYETRWGTFTDPWTHQPIPKCGFNIVGTAGTLSSYDFENTVRLQTKANPEGVEIPVNQPAPPYQNPIQYAIHCLKEGISPAGPISPEVSRIGQMMVDAAFLSASERRTVKLSEIQTGK